jgi:hypothetical protein
MGMFRRLQAEPECVDVAARLVGYEATRTSGLDGRYASGYTHPSSPLAGGPGHIAAPPDVPTERRGAVRYPVLLPVRAKSRGDEEWHVGQSVDASESGLCLDMPCPPDEGYLDVELESTAVVTAWARVVACTPTDHGRFRWRLRLVSYDPGYPVLLEALEAAERGVEPPTLEPRDDEGVVVSPLGWGQLLDRATA